VPEQLPPTASARLARFAGSTVRSGLLSVPSAAGLEAVGLEPIGEVMGACVRQLSRYTPMAYRSRTEQARATVRLGSDQWMPYHFYVNTANTGYATTLARIAAEARSLGGDGVVDIRLEYALLDDVLHEFTATGTAVRARSSTRAARPFTTTLAGPDVAKLMLSGWVPVEAHVVVEVGLGWASYTQGRQMGWHTSTNFEIDGYSKVINRVWASARAKLRSRLTRSGADGGLLTGSASRTWLHEGALAAELSVTGTAVARFSVRPHAARPLTVLPLR
jgi:uncharacterized protein YbjQ (UPF0145 family)